MRKGLILRSGTELQIQPGDTQDNWTCPDSSIIDFATFPVNVRNPGEVIYTGLSLHDYLGLTSVDDANYAFVVQVLGTRNLQLDLRVRRVDENNFIALQIDSEADTVTLIKTESGVDTVLDQGTYSFEWEGIHFYNIEIGMYADTIIGLINHLEVVSATSVTFRTEPGFSLYFPTVDSQDIVALYQFKAIETLADIPPSLNDPDNLYLQFRLNIKEQIENPAEYTWESYQKAVKFYEQRHVGMPDKEWALLGYPIRKPVPAQWFS